MKNKSPICAKIEGRKEQWEVKMQADVNPSVKPNNRRLNKRMSQLGGNMKSTA